MFAPDYAKGALKRGILTNGGMQELIFITEGDVYRLIVHSKLPSAERFELWVFDEVLPSIRKQGAYLTTETMEKVMKDPDAWIKVFTALKDERRQKEQLQLKVETDKPKVIFANVRIWLLRGKKLSDNFDR